ncbi:anti-sigma F factor [[Clostridium] polysaccharolyticum]|uniref:Anti-sigma F factor n=1 Tax=[Clostridium] polysaccharolyticum TaxID=29364 RepID=A0A1H9Y6N1_9FIRM|nr:anti-sigma F factor [[Clostridium] polysaccharolyticum]SES64540.1 stage II sporulation protein AB (anti-sigma F factor) [[Clostridium] polysaccharolyticum]
MNTNEMKIEFDSKSENESFARVAVAVFAAQLDPNMEELSDIKTAVSEAVTNCIIHGYEGREGKVKLSCRLEDKTITIVITDDGCGIEDVEKAMEPLYTTKPDLERSGMGFAFMEAFMDDLSVESELGKGTKITMVRTIKGSKVQS